MTEKQPPPTIIDALPPALQAAAKDATTDLFFSGEEPLVAHPEDLALAHAARCSYDGCKRWAELGDRDSRCPRHKIGHMLTPSHLYDKHLENAPSLLSIQESIRELEQIDNIDDDIVLLRAIATRYVAVNASKLELGDPACITFALELINKVSILIERRNGKKYTVTLTGINVIIQQVVSILEVHLQAEPELLRKIALDLATIKLPPGSLSK